MVVEKAQKRSIRELRDQDPEGELSISLLCITNRPSNFSKYIKRFRGLDVPIIAVVPNKVPFIALNLGFSKIVYIESESKNFSYLANLGSYFIRTSHYVMLYDDEEINNPFMCFIKGFKMNCESVRVTTIGCFGDKPLRFWTGHQPRIFRKGVKWIYRVHEKAILRESSFEMPELIIMNKSYDDWGDLVYKAKSVGRRERKTVRRFLILFLGSFYCLFFRGGLLDGIVGIRVFAGSIFYAFFAITNGLKGHIFLNPEDIEERIKNFPSVNDELNYIKQVLNRTESSPPTNIEEFEEELEQLSSTLITSVKQ